MAKKAPELEEYKYGFRDEHKAIFQSGKGLTREIVTEISRIKGEPEWMLNFRLKSLEQFEKMAMPRWGGDLSELDFNDIQYYVRPSEKQGKTWEEVPAEIKETFDKLGIPEAEQKFLAGVSAQYESEVVYHSIQKDLEDQGVIFMDTDSALREYPELFKEYFGTVVPAADNKFAALNSAVWSGGSFIYVPKGVKCEVPLQAYFRINSENMGQFERTLIIADEGSFVHYTEGCTAPIYSTNSLHSAVVEIIVKKDARVRYTTIQNWAPNIYNLVTKTCGSRGERDDGMGRRQHRLQADDEIPGGDLERPRRERQRAVHRRCRQRPASGCRGENDSPGAGYDVDDRVEVDFQTWRQGHVPWSRILRPPGGRREVEHQMRYADSRQRVDVGYDPIQ
ncbi:hypothetical protein HMSSN139_23510 [Paenibacillus sp. HMSSN-139]|nr:hypothetical protein HMSSN139_23510 [Paenibacillus sp. HMSSN-139]